MAIKFHCLANHVKYIHGRYRDMTFEPKLAFYNNALIIWKQFIDDIELNCYLDIGDIHREIGECYTHFSLNDYQNAEIHYNLALENYEQAENIDVFLNAEYIYLTKIKHGDKKYLENLLKSYDSDDFILFAPVNRLPKLYETMRSKYAKIEHHLIVMASQI